MARLGFFAFSIWFLLQPFTVVTSFYLGILALDKLLAPVLILFWAVSAVIGKQRIDTSKISYLLIAFAFFIIRNVSKIDEPEIYQYLLWEDAILFGYFCLPILFVDNLERVKTASKLISVNAVLACVSAFLVAVGWLTLPYERSSAGRFDLTIQKSIGLYSSYGDVAQISAFFLLLALFVSTILALRKKSSGWTAIKIFAFIVVIIGVIGNQSRSMILSLIVAVSMALIFHFRSKATNKLLYNTLLIAIGTVAVSVSVVVINQIISLLGSFGGADAAGTAAGRLEQYQYAFSVIGDNPILGVDGSYYSKYGAYVRGIHNMWLGQMARGGILSVLLLLWLLLRLLKASLRLQDNPETRPYGSVAVGFLFAVFTSTLFYPADTQFFWPLLGMGIAIVCTMSMHKSHRS
ncbi:O-antigen ligase family protein [Thiohalobacter thiocyanaticus]|uniref:O-antigen ligase domain-containing protein n=1 Tax=Thiohalobacter thiocyanaticus TaxID=585455 RepID=A0A426QIV4_9GAMM|nr:O-antigen ligase family protein [Thiohalobacter thiocyanaticus]RRQ21646.1 O-antigen ligase domain-containing protein [Thiohalobacter thiocyanaticus]